MGPALLPLHLWVRKLRFAEWGVLPQTPEPARREQVQTYSQALIHAASAADRK